MKKAYWEQMTVIKIDGELTNEVEIERRFHQICIL